MSRCSCGRIDCPFMNTPGDYVHRSVPPPCTDASCAAAVNARIVELEQRLEARKDCHEELPNANCGCARCTAFVVEGLEKELAEVKGANALNKAALKNALAAAPSQREHDLVRQMRMALHSESLITNEEYATLASEQGGVQRLEDYDKLRAHIEMLKVREVDGKQRYADAMQEVERLKSVLDSPELVETLAALEHARWAHWMEYLYSCCTWQETLGVCVGVTETFHEVSHTATIPADKVDRWQRQMETAYADLFEKEKKSDRAEARKTLAAIHAALPKAECRGCHGSKQERWLGRDNEECVGPCSICSAPKL